MLFAAKSSEALDIPGYSLPEEDAMQDLYKKYAVSAQFRGQVLGGIPKVKGLIEPWLCSKGLSGRDLQTVAQTTAIEVQAKQGEDLEIRNWTGFKKDREGLFIEERQIKALLKEAAYVLRLSRIAGFKDSISHGVFVKPEKIRLLRAGKPLHEPDGYVERPIHVLTRQGPRTSVVRQDFVLKPHSSFDLVVASPLVRFDDLQRLLRLGEEIGLGASRSQGFGKFVIKELKPTH